MRRGCIAVQQVHCDGCARTIKHPERYLVMDDEANQPETGQRKTLRYCVDCCLSRGYAVYRTEKGEKILTLLEAKE